MKRVFVGLGLGALLACGGGKSGGDPVLDRDYASSFTGNWTGPFTMTMNGTSKSTTALLAVGETPAWAESVLAAVDATAR